MEKIYIIFAGLNAYYALFRRTETQFRDERVHRLLVPILFLDLVTNLLMSLVYLSPSNPYKKEGYSYVFSLHKFLYHTLRTNQAWYLVYVFVYSQMWTYWFCAFHPNHNKPGESDLSYCGSARCCFSKKPFNRLIKVFCCLNFGFKSASTPEEYVSAVKWFLGGPIRLAILPGLLIGIVEAIEQA